MKTFKKMRFISILLTLTLVVIMAVPTMSSAFGPTPLKVELLSTSGFAILSGLSITNTGTTTINGDAGGDVGMSPGLAGSFTGQASVTMTGASHMADAVAVTAKTDLVTVYNDAAGRVGAIVINDELGGKTLTPGVYKSLSGTFQITGTLTLDAQGDPDGVFIFQMATTLTTISASNVSLINSARFCRTFWQVGSSATLGVGSHFVGHIFAMDSITVTTGATVQGQLLARNASVTLDTNTITNGICLAPPVIPIPNNPAPSNPTPSTPSPTPVPTPVAPPIIKIIKTATPEVLTTGRGLVTYTYKVTNPGMVPLNNVSVTDDKVSLVNYTSGDINADNLLQPSETWIYTSSANLTATTRNTATAKGSANGMTATDITFATVVVTQNAPIYPPLINVVKTPKPLALTTGKGTVTYTYKITNPGKIALSNVSITDDKISLVNYVSGDTNSDKLLQPNETWIYTSKAVLTETTRNTATVKGSANGMTATDVTFATVIVTNNVAVYPPLINVIKTPNPLALTSGKGWVTYTYEVTNPGMVALKNVSIVDDKVSLVNYVSGDVNADKLLQSSEKWIYTSKAYLTKTTRNTVTVKGSANGLTATDIAFATVIVSVKTTVTGGKLPSTSTPLYELILFGTALILIGAAFWKSKKRYE